MSRRPRRLLVAALALALVVGLGTPGAAEGAAPAVTHHSAKKGVATWQMPGVTGALKDVGASWYYNWSATKDGMASPAGVQFVPMIWGADSVTDANLAAAARQKVILGFNEPDLAGQADLTVDEALDLWPRLQATGRRLGSPAVAWGADQDGQWLDRFMAGAKQRGLRVDFITLHWYGSDFSSAATGQLESYLRATYRKYKLPIWVTEYSLIRFASTGPQYPTTAQRVAFVKTSTTMMEKLAFVERYAWFGLPADGYPNGLYRDGRTPTATGKAYRAVGA